MRIFVGLRLEIALLSAPTTITTTPTTYYYSHYCCYDLWAVCYFPTSPFSRGSGGISWVTLGKEALGDIMGGPLARKTLGGPPGGTSGVGGEGSGSIFANVFVRGVW